jgi:hypothetical protein
MIRFEPIPHLRHDLSKVPLGEIVLSSRGLVPPGWIEDETVNQRLSAYRVKEQRSKMVILKIEVEHQSERKLLIQQDMAWWFVQIVRVMDMSRVQNANVAQSAGALDLLGGNRRKSENMEPHGQSPWYLHVLRRNPPKHTLLHTRLRRVILLAFIHGHRPWFSA